MSQRPKPNDTADDVRKLLGKFEAAAEGELTTTIMGALVVFMTEILADEPADRRHMLIDELTTAMKRIADESAGERLQPHRQ